MVAIVAIVSLPCYYSYPHPPTSDKAIFSDMISAKPTCRNMLVIMMYIYFTVNGLVASFSISESDPELGVKDFHGSTMERGHQ